MGPQRPNLIGLVCWILIIGGFYGLVQAMKTTLGGAFDKSMEGYPYPPALAATLEFAPRVLMVIVGILMYECHGWARYVYIVLMPFFFVHQYFSAAKIPPPTVPTLVTTLHGFELPGMIVLYLLSIAILFLPSARRYYHPPKYIDE